MRIVILALLIDTSEAFAHFSNTLKEVKHCIHYSLPRLLNPDRTRRRVHLHWLHRRDCRRQARHVHQLAMVVQCGVDRHAPPPRIVLNAYRISSVFFLFGRSLSAPDCIGSGRLCCQHRWHYWRRR